MLTCFVDILPRLSHVSIALKQIFTYDVQLLTLFKSQVTRLLHDTMHVHQTFGDSVDLGILLSHYLVLYLKIYSQFLVILLAWGLLSHRFMPRLLMPLILSTPAFVCISSRIFNTQRWESGHLRIFRPSIQILLILSLCLYRLKQLFSPIFLNPELLLYSSYLACCIRIKVGLL